MCREEISGNGQKACHAANHEQSISGRIRIKLQLDFTLVIQETFVFSTIFSSPILAHPS